MSGLVAFLERRFVPLAAKIGGQKHLVAIRDAFAGLMPLVMAGSIAVLLNNVFFAEWSLLAEFTGGGAFFVWATKWLCPVGGIIWNGTLAILALGLVFGLGYHRAQAEDQDPLSTGLINVACFILLGALTDYLGALGIFVAILVGLIAPGIYFWVVRRNWTIKMPEQVPPAVAKGFIAVIPGFITILLISLVAYAFQMIPAEPTTIFAFIDHYLVQAMLKLSQGLFSIVLISFLIPLFWFFGLHGANILEAVMSPVYGALGTLNMELFTNGVRAVGSGANELSVWVRGSWDAYVFSGGSGTTLALIAAIFVFSKVKEHREIAKLGVGPGIFMINEPILFGVPIVLNPIFLIPFLLVQPVLTIVAYLATVAGIAGPIVNTVPWTTPPILNAYLATNGSIGAALVALVNLVIAFVIYLPFVLVANRQKEKEAEEQAKLAS